MERKFSPQLFDRFYHVFSDFVAGLLTMTLGLGLVSLSALERAEAAPGASKKWSQRPGWAQKSRSSLARERKRDPAAAYSRRRHITPFSPDSHNVALELGQVFLFGDFGANYGDNLGARIRYTYGVSDLFGFDSSLGFSKHPDANNNNFSSSMTSATAGVRTNLSWYDQIIPHFNFGLGFYRPVRDTSATTSVSALLFGIHAGPGIDLIMSDQMYFGANLTFHDIFGNEIATNNNEKIQIGGTHTAFMVHAGYTF